MTRPNLTSKSWTIDQAVSAICCPDETSDRTLSWYGPRPPVSYKTVRELIHASGLSKNGVYSVDDLLTWTKKYNWNLPIDLVVERQLYKVGEDVRRLEFLSIALMMITCVNILVFFYFKYHH